MTKEEAREMLNTLICRSSFYNLPIYDEVLVNGTKYNEKCDTVFFCYSFRYLMKKAYCFKDVKKRKKKKVKFK